MTLQRVYCSGLWIIDDNKKHSVDHYLDLLPKTFDMIRGSKLCFYSNNADIIENARQLSKERNIVYEESFKAIEDLPGWEMSESFLHACTQMQLDKFPSLRKNITKDKGTNHYWRDFKFSGERPYRSLMAVWLSKVALARSTAAEQGCDSTVCWIDASVARFNGRRGNWDFAKVPTPRGKVTHYPTTMFFYGRKLPLSASFLAADLTSWTTLLAEFNESAARAVKMPYGHDEETVLADCVYRLPQLFHCVRTKKPPPSMLSSFRNALFGSSKRPHKS